MLSTRRFQKGNKKGPGVFSRPFCYSSNFVIIHCASDLPSASAFALQAVLGVLKVVLILVEITFEARFCATWLTLVGRVGYERREKARIMGIMKALKPAEEKFVQALIEGRSQREAWKVSHPKSKATDRVVDNMASALLKKHEVSVRYKALKDEVARKADEQADETTDAAARIIAEYWRLVREDAVEYVTDEDGDGNVKSRRIRSNRTVVKGALDKLAEIYGVTADQREQSIHITFDDAEDGAD